LELEEISSENVDLDPANVDHFSKVYDADVQQSEQSLFSSSLHLELKPAFTLTFIC
jgi:hypothetical protein